MKIDKGKLKFILSNVFFKHVDGIIRETLHILWVNDACHCFSGKSFTRAIRIQIDRTSNPDLIADNRDLPNKLCCSLQKNILACLFVLKKTKPNNSEKGK